MDYLEMIGKQLLSFTENFTFFYVVFRKTFRELHKKEVTGIVTCCVILLVATCFGWGFLDGLTPFSPSLFVLFVMLYFMFQISVKEMFGLALAQWVLISMIEMGMYVTFWQKGWGRNMLDYIIMLSISSVLWIYYYLIGRKLDRYMFWLPVKMWYLLDCIMFILVLMLSFFSYVVVEKLPDGKNSQVGKILVILGGNLICILLFALIYYFNKTKKYQLQKEFMEQKNEQQKEYFLLLLEKEEQTKRFRHDIIDHLLELKNYCEKQDYVSLESYLTDTLGIIQDISKCNFDLGNDIVNTIVNYYFQPIREICAIEVDGWIDENIGIEQRDLCTLTANLVKNAVEAVEQLEQGHILFIANMGKNYLSIRVENTYAGKRVLDKEGMPQTTKSKRDNHGIGLKNVREIVRKYEGEYHADIKEEWFIVEAFLKI